jgi:hypothetical protein
MPKGKGSYSLKNPSASKVGFTSVKKNAPKLLKNKKMMNHKMKKGY